MPAKQFVMLRRRISGASLRRPAFSRAVEAGCAVVYTTQPRAPRSTRPPRCHIPPLYFADLTEVLKLTHIHSNDFKEHEFEFDIDPHRKLDAERVGVLS